MRDIRVGEIFWYAVGCFYDWKDGSTQDVGYFVQLGGLPDLMAGAPGPAGARFTFAAEPFRPDGLPVNDPADTFSASVDPPRQFTLYYQREPAGDFAHPESFRRGLAIATFERVSPVVGGSTALAAMVQFTAHLVGSTPFDHAGHRVDLAERLGSVSPRPGSPARRSPPRPARRPRRARSWAARCGSDLARHQPAAAAANRGSRTVKHVPWPGSDATVIDPPCAVTTSRAM